MLNSGRVESRIGSDVRKTDGGDEELKKKAHAPIRTTAALKPRSLDPTAVKRREMVERLRKAGITDGRVLEAMGSAPRHIFVDSILADRAYEDNSAPIGSRQTISRPGTVALMTQLAALKGDETALEIGTGSGYQAAVLGLLCQRVITVERINALSNKARKIFNELHLDNIVCLVGDGSVGAPKYAPFDVIMVTAVAPALPKPLADQLKEGGRLVVPVGEGSSQKLVLARKSRGRLVVEEKDACNFVPLIGEMGFSL
jgi:protein-L-isoaspartate(D-aspartate) O-methyltransferase